MISVEHLKMKRQDSSWPASSMRLQLELLLLAAAA
jgi:hypothetical protein